ncbi:TetR/AcrR family transcriptional regulator [Rhodovastum atsumiense]|uniref:TetR/AcrR family transcriptional regulator n=1 Tax=Rhodovastum atsumiense TaxID=504468 RepID=A0A5M6IQW7_9PROT|nr:TetR/AcrR family transcriptional regulator [Rhodovastum atsumiense]KAA5610684.1 TetR/AcrR family transcriptional regulator [Rhodovastum atsumiense]CAH2603319.1 TetR/AcrR family transcriptional regulator [Rhodovastum atsumiense]
MARPREFDEAAVLDAAMHCFWQRGYEQTSMRDLAGEMGMTSASMYNAFGDKRALYRRALDHYLAQTVRDRIARFAPLPPLAALRGFFTEIVERSVADRQRRGCMLVNSALEVAPHDAGFRRLVAGELEFVEAFFRRCIAAGQQDGTITAHPPAEKLAKLLLSLLLGIRVLARTRPQRAVLDGAAQAALALLQPEPPATVPGHGSDGPPG